MKETINSFIELGDKVIEQEEEIEKLTNELDREKSKVKEYGTRLLKAIEYIHNNYPVCAGKELLDILGDNQCQ